MKNIYDQIKSVAAHHGVQIQELAERMGITRQTLNNSMKSPSYPTLVRIAEALDLPLWELFVAPTDDCSRLVCPHCGQPINVTLDKKPE